MRKVKVGAIQPRVLDIPKDCDIFSDCYRADAQFVFAHNIKPQLDVTLELLKQAGDEGCDIVTTSEDLCAISHYLADTSKKNIFPALADIGSRCAEEELSALAAQYGMYIVACYFKPYADGIYNVASVFSRTGEIIAEYRKTHLPPNEMWQVKEGGALNAIDLDFGRIGILICYDMMFSEAAEVLSHNGAEIVFHPTGGYGWYDEIGEATVKVRANDCSFYIVTAKNYRFMGAGKSSVVDFWGQILADAGFYENTIVTKIIDLDFPKTQPGWYYPTEMSGMAGIRERKLAERRPELYGPLITPNANKLIAPCQARQAELFQMIKEGRCHW